MSIEPRQHFDTASPWRGRTATGSLILSQMSHHEQRPVLFPEPPPLIFLEDGTVFDPDEDALPPVSLPAPVPPEAPTEALASVTLVAETVPPVPVEQQEQETVAIADSATATTPVPDLPVYWTRRLLRLAGGLSVALWVLVMLFALVAPWLSPQATVTIKPMQDTLSASLTITALPSVPNPARLQVAARLLSLTSPTRTGTHATTGVGHQPARVGHGTITFYNAALTPQLILAGTLLTGSDGVQIVTEQDVLLPAAIPPSEGQVSVPAQAVQVGPQGNIAAGDVQGACCRENVFVHNSAFVGGQDARDYPVVAAEDINTLAIPLVAALTQSTRMNLQGQIRPNEQAIQPLVCSPTVTPDHPAGREAAQVSVTVTVTCQAETYDEQAVERLALAKLSRQAVALGAGYALQGKLSAIVTHETLSPSDLVTLFVHAHGTWSYRISTADLHRLAQRIAGKTTAEARRLIEQQESGQVGTIEIGFTGWWSDGVTLPTDPARIHLLVVVQ